MNGLSFKFTQIVWATVAALISAVPAVASARPVVLGPSNPGAESGFEGWYYGVLGGGSVSIDHDPAKGNNDFRIGITKTTSSPTNRADLRSELFPLGAAVNGRRAITLSFRYMLPDKVKAGDDIALYLRFFDETGTHFFDQKPIFLGSRTDDSEMAVYKTMVLTNIFAPREAVAADIWITANIFEPWTSGTAQFDEISVTTVSALPWGRIFVGAAIVAGVIASLVWIAHSRKRSQTYFLMFLLGIACLAVVTLVFRGRKSGQQSAEGKAIARHEQQLKRQKAANLEFQKQLKVPGMRSTLDAGEFLARLLDSGRLPGAENFERGAMLSPASAETLLPNVYTPQPTNYPLSRTFNGQRKLGGAWENHYTVVKMSADSPWQIKRAWRTDAQGNTVEEYQVK